MLETSIKAIPSAYNIISSNRSIGYSFDAAVADIIDNSISAGATEIELFSPVGKNLVLKITDNGCGMDLAKLTEAMTFGGNVNCQELRDLKDLGRFGMGLKTASLSQCKRLEVITKKDGMILGGCWDLDVLKKHDSWEFLLLDEETCKQEISDTLLQDPNVLSGTTVIWKKFDRLKESTTNQQVEFDRLLDKAIKKLELVFHRYLSGEEGLSKINIAYNKNKLEPNDPFLVSKTPEIAQPIELEVNGSIVSILSHKLPHPTKLSRTELDKLCLGSTLLETQGFYIYRTKRLIDYGTWFGMASKLEKTNLSRIQIDIPNTLDSEWSLDIKKSHTIPPQVIRQELRIIVENNGERSSTTFKTRKRRGAVTFPYWNRHVSSNNSKNCVYTINMDHPLITGFMDQLKEEQIPTFKMLLSNIAKFFPFSSVEVDCQNDLHLNEKDENFDRELPSNIILLYKSGLTKELIINLFPGYEEKIEEILSEV